MRIDVSTVPEFKAWEAIETHLYEGEENLAEFEYGRDKDATAVALLPDLLREIVDAYRLVCWLIDKYTPKPLGFQRTKLLIEQRDRLAALLLKAGAKASQKAEAGDE